MTLLGEQLRRIPGLPIRLIAHVHQAEDVADAQGARSCRSIRSRTVVRAASDHVAALHQVIPGHFEKAFWAAAVS